MIWAAVGALGAVVVPLLVVALTWLRSDIREMKGDLGGRLDRMDRRIDQLAGEVAAVRENVA